MKTTKEELDLRSRRTQSVLQILLDGAMPHDVRDFVAEKEKGAEEPWIITEGEKPMTPAQIATIIKLAEKQIAACYPGDDPITAMHKAKL